jgi:hypothetical protein
MAEWRKVEPGSWKPEVPGESVEGLYVNLETNQGEFNSNIYHIRKEDGELVAVWGKTVLDNRMAAVQVGNEVRIVFTGTEPSKRGGSDTKLFEVFDRVPEGNASLPTEDPSPPKGRIDFCKLLLKSVRVANIYSPESIAKWDSFLCGSPHASDLETGIRRLEEALKGKGIPLPSAAAPPFEPSGEESGSADTDGLPF